MQQTASRRDGPGDAFNLVLVLFERKRIAGLLPCKLPRLPLADPPPFQLKRIPAALTKPGQ